MNFKHILQPPRTGKTSAILAGVSDDVLIVTREVYYKAYRQFILHQPYNAEHILTEKQVLHTKMDMNRKQGINYREYNKLYIDELLAFEPLEMKWLYVFLQTRLHQDMDVVAYSTPKKQFSKEAYLLAKHGIKATPDIMLSEADAKVINQEINEINMYLLNPVITILQKSLLLGSTKDNDVKSIREKAQIMLGDETFGIMYDLKVLK